MIIRLTLAMTSILVVAMLRGVLGVSAAES